MAGETIGATDLPELVQPKKKEKLPVSIFRFVLEGAEYLEGSKMQRLVDFYSAHANEFALKNGLMPIPEKDESGEWIMQRWIPYQEYKLINQLHSDLIGYPEMVFYELVKNARMHGNHNDPTKYVTVYSEWKGDTFTLSVTDQGRGFGSSDLAGDNIGCILIGDFATQQIKTKTDSGGFTIIVRRNLGKKIAEIDRDVESDYGFADIDKVHEIRDEIQKTGKLKLKLEDTGGGEEK
jgi:hypothetical protein